MRGRTVFSDGAFRFPNVAPGKYRLVAADNAEIQILDSEEDLERIAETVEVDQGQTVVKDVKRYRTGSRPR